MPAPVCEWNDTPGRACVRACVGAVRRRDGSGSRRSEGGAVARESVSPQPCTREECVRCLPEPLSETGVPPPRNPLQITVLACSCFGETIQAPSRIGTNDVFYECSCYLARLWWLWRRIAKLYDWISVSSASKSPGERQLYTYIHGNY